MTWLGYMRVSRVGGREHLISPELQAKRIANFAELRGFTIEMLPPELDVSGGKASRPILDAAIERIEHGEVEGIIVSQMDRLSRMQMVSALKVIERIEKAGGQVIAVAENVDPTTPEGRMARNMFLSLGAMQRERHADAIAEAKERAVRHGIWPMSKIPPGYIKGEDRRLRFGEDAPRVRAAFRCRASGGSWRQVGELLDVGPSSARKIIQNRVYLGELTVGKWHNPAAHRPLIDRELWESAQIEHAAPNRTGQVESLLRGIVRCGGCQRTMSWSEYAYRCVGRARCDLRSRAKHTLLDDLAVRILFEHADAAVEAQETVTDNTLVTDLETAEAELAAFQRASLAAGDEDMFTDGLRQRAEAVKAARAKLTGRPRTDVPPVNIRAEWGGMDLSEKRHVLGSLFGVIWVWGHDDFRFVARGFEPDGLSRPGRKGPEPFPIESTDLEGEIRVPSPHDVP